MIVLVDASVIASILVPEEQSARAERLLVGEYELVAPDHLQVEVYSVLLKSLRRGRSTEEDVAGCLTDFRGMPISFVPSSRYLDAALDIARRRGGSIYDALYVVGARAHAAPVVTHDRRLGEIARAEGVAVIMVTDLPLS